jgi:aspartate 1-decarboxylase
MQLTLLKSKIHRASVTGASVHYEGSLTISADLAELAGLLPYEKILVGNLSNGERFETYVIYGEARRESSSSTTRPHILEKLAPASR